MNQEYSAVTEHGSDMSSEGVTLHEKRMRLNKKNTKAVHGSVYRI